MERFSGSIDLDIVGGVPAVEGKVQIFKEHLLGRADHIFPVGSVHLLGNGNGPPAPLLLHGVAQLTGHFICRGAGAAGIGEDVHIRKIALANEFQALAELLLRLPGECHDHVRGDGAAGEGLPQEPNTFIIPGGIIFPVHPGKDGIAAGLHTQMELGAQIGILPKPGAEFLCNHPGFQAAQTVAHLGKLPAQALDEIRHRGLAGQIHAPAGNFNTGNDDLPVALGGNGPGLLQSGSQGRRADGATGIGNNAVGAEIDAAILHLQHGPGALLQSAGGQNLKFPAAQSIVQMVDMLPAFQSGYQVVQKFLPTAGAAQHVHPQTLYRLRVMLGIAAAHTNDGLGILPAAAADDGPVLFVRNGGDGAGIDDVGIVLFFKGADFVTAALQQLLHSLGFVLIGLAAQGIKRNSHIVNIANFQGVPL